MLVRSNIQSILCTLYKDFAGSSCIIGLMFGLMFGLMLVAVRKAWLGLSEWIQHTE